MPHLFVNELLVLFCAVVWSDEEQTLIVQFEMHFQLWAFAQLIS